MYIDKLKEMLKLVEENHLDMYFNISKKDLEVFIKEVLKKYKIQDDYDFYYVFNLIIKKIFGRFDSHTQLYWKDGIYLPIRFKYIDDKLYITEIDQEKQEFLYGQVLKINNVDIKKLIKEKEAITAYSTKEYLSSNIESSFYRANIIKSLPSIDNNTCDFNFEILLGNKKTNIILNSKEHYLLTSKNIKPNYYFELIDDIIYIVYKSCREDYQNQMLELVDKISKLAEENNINKFIIDLRGNGGGDSRIIRPLIEFLKDKKIVTLIDEKVFSSGRFAIVDLYNIGSKFVGTKIATDLNAFGNIKVFPYDEFTLCVANKYFYFPKENNKYSLYCIKNKEDFKKFKNNKVNHKYFEPNIFEPDYLIENTIEDYIDNFDRQKQEAINIINEKNYRR